MPVELESAGEPPELNADAWITRLRAAREPLIRLCSARETTRASPWAGAETVVDELQELAELAAPSRFPSLAHRPATGADHAVRSLLDARLRGESPEDCYLEPAREQGRITGDRVVNVPANWYVLYPWAADRLTETARDCRRVAGRCRSLNAERVADSYRGLARAADDLSDALAWLPTIALWHDPPEELVDADYQRIESFAKRSLEATTES